MLTCKQLGRGANQPKGFKLADMVQVYYCQEVQTYSDGISAKLDFNLMMQRYITILGFLVMRCRIWFSNLFWDLFRYIVSDVHFTGTS